MLGALLLLPTLVFATQFRPFTRAEQIRGSEVIVTGIVLEGHVRETPHPPGLLTEWSIEIDDVWKGVPDSDRLRVETPGGTRDGITSEVEGSARLREGDRVLLFLVSRDGSYRPWGMQFGVYRIEPLESETIAVGFLPPATPEAAQWQTVSLSLEELRREVEREASR